MQLAGSRHPERVLDVPAGVRVRRRRRAVRTDLEPIGSEPGEHAELIVVGVVLHHQDDNVRDIRDRIRAGREVRIRQRARLTAQPGRFGRHSAARSGGILVGTFAVDDARLLSHEASR